MKREMTKDADAGAYGEALAAAGLSPQRLVSALETMLRLGLVVLDDSNVFLVEKKRRASADAADAAASKPNDGGPTEAATKPTRAQLMRPSTSVPATTDAENKPGAAGGANSGGGGTRATAAANSRSSDGAASSSKSHCGRLAALDAALQQMQSAIGLLKCEKKDSACRRRLERFVSALASHRRAIDTLCDAVTAVCASSPPTRGAVQCPSAVTLAFCRSLPKAELHAHLNGSVRMSTLRELMTMAGVKDGGGDANSNSSGGGDVGIGNVLVGSADKRSLEQCFAVFDAIHAAVTTPEAVRRVAQEVADDMAADGVAYAELRTTPRRDVMSAEEYVAAVVAGLRSSAAVSSGLIRVRLLLSINRAQPVDFAEATVDLANSWAGAAEGQESKATVRDGGGEGVEIREAGEGGSVGADQGGGPPHRRQGWVVGVELSGNPHKGSFASFRPSLERARSLGLKVAVHVGEVANTDKEIDEVLDFAPDRLGHALTLSNDHIGRLLARLWEGHKGPVEAGGSITATSAGGGRQQQGAGRCDSGHERQRALPIEICPTSNVRTLKLDRAAAAVVSSVALSLNLDEIDTHAPPARRVAAIASLCDALDSVSGGGTATALRHHPTLRRWLDTGYPVSINTDDSSVFSTTLSAELGHVKRAFGLNRERTQALARAGWRHAFDDEARALAGVLPSGHRWETSLERDGEDGVAQDSTCARDHKRLKT